MPTNMLSSMYLNNLEYIWASGNSLTSLPDGFFDNSVLQKLKYIDFSSNKIEELPENLFNCSNLSNLEQLLLWGNKIKLLPEKLLQTDWLTSLNTVDLSSNEITFIPSHFFKRLTKLKYLYLDHNKIKMVTADIFSNHLNHSVLFNFSQNCISSIKELIPLFGRLGHGKERTNIHIDHNNLTVQPIKFISSLTNPNMYINLTYNKINAFETWPKTHRVPNLNTVLEKVFFDIRGNKVFNVANLVKAAMHKDLNRANWSNLALTVNYIWSYRDKHRLIRLSQLIKYFPYKYSCDCEMLTYLKMQQTSYFKSLLMNWRRDIVYITGTPVLLDFNKLLCGEPAHLKGKYLYELEKYDLQCHNINCTSVSKCDCINTPFNNTVRINCTGTNIKNIPYVLVSSKLEIYLGFNKLPEFPLPNINISQRVLVLDVSYNSIKYVPKGFFFLYPHITLLNLAGNLMTTLPLFSEWENMNSLTHLELAGNSFICNCSGLDLQKSLSYLNSRIQPYTRVQDIGRIKCKMPLDLRGKVIYTLPESLFGCPFVSVTLILAIAVTIILIFVLIIFIVYIFRYYINLCLFVHCGWRFYYNYTNEETTYDVFISYSSLDSDWVINHLVNPLEGTDPPFNLCLHERDFQVGIPICDNITKAIEGSKCTLAIVSRNWLESDWCQFEFRVAHCLATVEKKVRLLVILKEHIPDDKIDGDLRLYIKTFTYLDAANQLFWPRLLNDLPAPLDNLIIKKATQAEVYCEDNIDLQLWP